MVQRRTMYPNGESVTLDLECRPINVKLSDDNDPIVLVLMIGTPLSLQVTGGAECQHDCYYVERSDSLRLSESDIDFATYIFCARAGQWAQRNDPKPRNAQALAHDVHALRH